MNKKSREYEINTNDKENIMEESEKIDFSSKSRKTIIVVGIIIVIVITIVLAMYVFINKSVSPKDNKIEEISNLTDKSENVTDNKPTSVPIATENAIPTTRPSYAPIEGVYELEEPREELMVGTTLEPEEMAKTPIKIDSTYFNDNHIYKLDNKTNYEIDINGDGENEIVYCEAYTQKERYSDNNVHAGNLYVNGMLFTNSECGQIKDFYILDIDNSDGCYDICLNYVDDENTLCSCVAHGCDINVEISKNKEMFNSTTRHFVSPQFFKTMVSDWELNYDGEAGMAKQIYFANKDLEIKYIQYRRYPNLDNFGSVCKENLFEVYGDENSIGRELNKTIKIYSKPDLESATTVLEPQKVDFIVLYREVVEIYSEEIPDGEELWFYIEAEDGTKGWMLIIDGKYEGNEEIF